MFENIVFTFTKCVDSHCKNREENSNECIKIVVVLIFFTSKIVKKIITSLTIYTPNIFKLYQDSDILSFLFHPFQTFYLFHLSQASIFTHLTLRISHTPFILIHACNIFHIAQILIHTYPITRITHIIYSLYKHPSKNLTSYFSNVFLAHVSYFLLMLMIPNVNCVKNAYVVIALAQIM